jgi:hypothetical protein
MQRESVRLRSAPLLRELMKAANGGQGYSLRDMADRLPCGKSMVHALVSGEKQTCRAELGERIAEVVGVPFAVLFAPAPSIRPGRPSRQQDVAA